MKKQLACILLGLMSVGQAWAILTPAHWDPTKETSLADWHWGGVQQFYLPQARLFVRQFNTPLSPDRAAKQISAAAGARLTRLQFSAEALFLSGMDRQDHWLVQLRATRQGATGMVSRLSPQPIVVDDFDPSRLAPPGARRILHLMDGANRGAASFSSFNCLGGPVQVRAQVQRALFAAGWQPRDRQPGPLLAPDWYHPKAGGLTVQLLVGAASTTLTFWHRPKDIP